MHANFPALNPQNDFETDTLDWFLGNRHGHMGKWQYIKPKFKNDPCRGDELWDAWENLSQEGNMLNRQKEIIRTQVDQMVALTGPTSHLLDLGPGGHHAVISNTVPFVQAYDESLTNYTAIDINEIFAKDAAAIVHKNRTDIAAKGINKDFYSPEYTWPAIASVVLFNGGSIGNYQAPQNTPDSINLMAGQIKKLKRSMPANSYILIGLEATQTPRLLYGDYDHPAHAAYEINVMYGIKRDLIPLEDGFDPSAWKYTMAWWPDAYQFCHIAEATKKQKFKMLGRIIELDKGHQLVVDNSFKFPMLAMQRAAQLAGAEYLKPFMDDEGRMAIHALKL